jgi:hypothetical protein
MIATQRLPYHYFQRPDADHLELDSSATSLTGFAGSASLGYRIGRHWNFGAGFNTISPDYEISDLGFQRRADRADIQTSARYREQRPGRFRQYQTGVTWLLEHNYSWETISDRIFWNSFVQFLNYWGVEANWTFSLPGTIDDRLTRGGPRAKRPAYVSANPSIGSDPRRAVVLNIANFTQWSDADRNFDWFAEVVWKPRPSLDMAIGPSLGWDKSNAQFLGRITDPAATRTYGSRYLFANVDQTTLSLDTRVNYTFSPTLSLQVFMQPFIASGRYGAAKEFAEPGEYKFLVYGRDVGQISNGRIYPNGTANPAVSFAVPDPNFNVRSLRGNAVMKWDWRPGSTMYVAWQQTRNSFQPIGEFRFGHDIDQLFGSVPDNIFLVKVSYWLNP